MVNLVAVLILVVLILGLAIACFGAGFLCRPYIDKLRPPKVPPLTPEEKVALDKARGEAREKAEHLQNLVTFRGKPQTGIKREGIK